MVRRVTVLLDDDVIKKLRLKQAQEIKKSKKSVSFSKIIIDTLKQSF